MHSDRLHAFFQKSELLQEPSTETKQKRRKGSAGSGEKFNYMRQAAGSRPNVLDRVSGEGDLFLRADHIRNGERSVAEETVLEHARKLQHVHEQESGRAEPKGMLVISNVFFFSSFVLVSSILYPFRL